MIEDLKNELGLVRRFLELQWRYWGSVLAWLLGWTGEIKKFVSRLMYRQRGRFSQSFINASMAGLFFAAIFFSGKVEEMISGRKNGSGGSSYLAIAQDDGGVGTLISDSPKGEITEYRVKDGDTVSAIAQKYGVSIDTIVWENNLKSVSNLKPQQVLRILPVTGVRYKVSRGETIYSIAKKFQVDPQNIIDYPFNTFADDEKFSLLAGQELVIPDGIKPNEALVDTPKVATRRVEPIPGVRGEGNFMWPTSGHITQKFYWYHQAVDIANASNPPVVASQGGTVIVAGWNGGGYGNYVVIDHGNGYQTLYGHMLNNSVVVKAGDRVAQGQRLGTMGSTGRSTGTHLHFEVKTGSGAKLDPLSVLK